MNVMPFPARAYSETMMANGTIGERMARIEERQEAHENRTDEMNIKLDRLLDWQRELRDLSLKREAQITELQRRLEQIHPTVEAIDTAIKVGKVGRKAAVWGGSFAIALWALINWVGAKWQSIMQVFQR